MEEKSVVVVDTVNHVAIPGRLLPGSATLVGTEKPQSLNADNAHLKAVIKDSSKISNPELVEILGKYPEVIMAEESLIFDEDAFYAYEIPTEKYIHPKYKIGDYVLGIVNPKCAEHNGVKTTIRLVGGTITGVKVISRLTCVKYSYEIIYTVRADVKYSAEQLRNDGRAYPDMRYAIDADLTGSTFSVLIDEACMISVISNESIAGNTKLSESEGYVLFYTMSTILLKAQMCILSFEELPKITEALVFGSLIHMYPRRCSNARSKERASTLRSYETPIRLLLEGICSAITVVSNRVASTEISDITNSSEISHLIFGGDIYIL